MTSQYTMRHSGYYINHALTRNDLHLIQGKKKKIFNIEEEKEKREKGGEQEETKG